MTPPFEFRLHRAFAGRPRCDHRRGRGITPWSLSVFDPIEAAAIGRGDAQFMPHVGEIERWEEATEIQFPLGAPAAVQVAPEFVEV